MKASDAIQATVHDLSHDGRGVADVDGRRIFVPGALPSERVLLKPRRRRRKLQEAELVDVVERAADRVTPGCEYFGICGGCAVQHLAYPAQVAFKQRVVAEAFSRIAGIAPERWLEPITGPEWAYRRRARLGVKYVQGKERALVGFRERAAPYVTDMKRCPVLAPPVGEALGDLSQVIGATSIRQRIPQVEVAIGDDAAALVLRVLDAPAEADLVLLNEFAARHDVDLYLQPGGPGTVKPVGRSRKLSYSLKEFGLRYEFEPTDFVQINAAINARMVATALQLAEVRATDRVLDLYCGLGNFSLPIAQLAAEVFGIEGDAGLVARAARNADLNGVSNVRFAAGDLSLADWRFFRERWDLVVLDPARTGAEAAVASMHSMTPRRVVYVSCHPATLARDAGVLVRRQGYRLSVAGILDMFPHTHHVEAIAIFDRS